MLIVSACGISDTHYATPMRWRPLNRLLFSVTKRILQNIAAMLFLFYKSAFKKILPLVSGFQRHLLKQSVQVLPIVEAQLK